jgi:hypothetical protein
VPVNFDYGGMPSMELSSVGESVFAAEGILKKRIRKVSFDI